MRRIAAVAAAIIMLTLAGCGSSSDSSSDSGGSAEMDEFVDSQKACAETVESGETVTAQLVEDCSDAFGRVGQECDGGVTVHRININGTEWILVEGEVPTVQPDGVESLRELCP